MEQSRHILREDPAENVARIVLDRPETRNAQDTELLYELNDALDAAAQDDRVKVIIIAANGPHFSSGHDLRETNHLDHMREHATVGTWAEFGAKGAEGVMAREAELYLGLCERWRAIPKPTIAQVHGKCIAGGLMLVWPCDLVVASDDAMFQDNTITMGMCGVEYFAHPWELGIRKAKEHLFTADWIDAEEAWRLGMVNRVVPRGDLERATLELASKIAAKSLFALKLIKQSVNAAQDAQGRAQAFQQAFALHQLGHSHNFQVHGMAIDPTGLAPTLRKNEDQTNAQK